MMKLCLLFGFCLAYALAAEETALSATCTPQLLNAHQQCEEEAISKGLGMEMQLKKDARECFEKNQCEFCSEEEEHSSGHGSGYTPSPAEKAEEECLKELRESEYKNLSACVIKESNGFNLPRFPGHHKKGHREERGHHSGDHSGSSEEHHSGHHSGSSEEHEEHHSGSGEWEERRKHKFERFEHRVQKACHNNNETVKAVFECLKAIKPVAEQDKEEFCAARKTCESDIKDKCDREDEKLAEEEIRKALTTCEPKTAIQELIKEAKACQALDPNHVERKHRESKGEHHGERHHSGHYSGHHSGSGHHPHFPHKEGEEHHSGHHSGHREGRKHRDFCKAKTAVTTTSG